MKKISTLFLIVLIHSGAMAGWDWVGSGGGGNIYVDKSTIRKSGSLIKMWYLQDFDMLQAKGIQDGVKPFLSSKDQSEYDCQEERRRTLYFSNHSGHMGTGDIVYMFTSPLEWIPVAPGSISEALWKIACM